MKGIWERKWWYLIIGMAFGDTCSANSVSRFVFGIVYWLIVLAITWGVWWVWTHVDLRIRIKP